MKTWIIFIFIFAVLTSCIGKRNSSLEEQSVPNIKAVSDSLYSIEGDTVIGGIKLNIPVSSFDKQEEYNILGIVFNIDSINIINDSVKGIVLASKSDYIMYLDYYPNGLEDMDYSETDFARFDSSYNKLVDFFTSKYNTDFLTSQHSKYERSDIWSFPHRTTIVKGIEYKHVNNEDSGGFIDRYYKIYIHIYKTESPLSHDEQLEI